MKKFEIEEFKRANLRSKGYKKILEEIELYIQDLMEYKDDLKDKLEQFNKEDELKKLNEELNHVHQHSLHILSKKEKDEATKFRSEHYQSCNSNIQYILEETGIGATVSVKCKNCNVIKNITDVDNW